MSSVVFLGVAAEVLNQQGPFAQHPRREPRALLGNWGGVGDGGWEIFETHLSLSKVAFPGSRSMSQTPLLPLEKDEVFPQRPIN